MESIGIQLQDIVLYCKSYRNDFLRLKRLHASIREFNQDSLPFYISTPRADREALLDILGTENSYIWIADEDIVSSNPRASFDMYLTMPGSRSQAIVKSEFWRLQIAKNYLCLDSDCLFIRPFRRSDFMADDGAPFTVLHQNKEYFQLAINRGQVRVVNNLRAEAQRVQTLFGRTGPRLYGAPAPFIWSAAVWNSLDKQYLQPSGMTLWDLVTPDYPETLIYIESLMKYQAIPIIAIEPLFRVYHYDWQYYIMKRLGESREKLKENYLGVIHQSNWSPELNFDKSNKSIASRLLKRIKKYLRYLQSYF